MEVHEHHIGLAFLHPSHGLTPILCFADHLHCGAGGQQCLQAFAGTSVVVGDQHANGLVHGYPHLSTKNDNVV
jgi:hypothetical protein